MIRNSNIMLSKFASRRNITCGENDDYNYDNQVCFACGISSLSSLFIAKELLCLLRQRVLWNQKIFHYLYSSSTLDGSIDLSFSILAHNMS